MRLRPFVLLIVSLLMLRLDMYERGASKGGRGCLQLRKQWDMVHVVSVEGRTKARVADRADIFKAHLGPSSLYGRHVGLGLVVAPTSLCHHLPSWMRIVASFKKNVGLWPRTTPTLESAAGF